MRKSILSFVIVFCAGLSILAVVHLLGAHTGGAALAAPGGGEVGQAEKEGQKDLRKSAIYRPENFLQLNGQDVRVLFKQPDLVRRDFPTVVWQYRNESCVLDFYFRSSSDNVTGAPVVHYEIRAREDGVADEEVVTACAQNIARSRSGPRMIDVSAIYKR